MKLPRFLLPLLIFVSFSRLIPASDADHPEQNARAEDWPGQIEYTFRVLKKRIQQDDGPSEIYALLGTLCSQCVIEVKSDVITLHCDDGLGRSRERTLKADELAKLSHWLVANKIDQLPPFEDGGTSGHDQYEYVHLTRDGTEARVPMTSPPVVLVVPSVIPNSANRAPKPEMYGALVKRFSDLSKVQMPVRYKSIEDLPGFRVVHTYEKGEAEKLSFRDGKLFASIRDENPKVWHEVGEDGTLAKGPREPSDPLLREWYPRYYASDTAYVEPKAGPYVGKCIWAGKRKKDHLDGLWVSGLKGEPELIVRGIFGPLVLSPDGQWLVAGHTINAGSDSRGTRIVRIHLQKKEIIPVALPEAEMLKPVSWVEAHQKVLLFHERSYKRAGLDEPEHYLLDVATGNFEKVTGEFAPLADYYWMPLRLQASSDANIFWATIDRPKPGHPGEFDTDFGRYNTRDFTSSILLHLPGVRVETDHIYVDENSRTLWMVLQGDIARIQF